MGGIHKRSMELGVGTCIKGFGGRDFVKSAVFDATTLPAVSGGTDEVQTVTITGTPTGGTFTLTFRGVTSAGIAYNASAAVVRAALEAMSTIGVGNVNVGGGPGPGTPWTVTFINTLGRQNVPQMTASAAGLTGGTSPAVAVTTSTAGDNSNVGRITLGTYDKPGTIVTKNPADTSKVKEYTGAGGEAIIGIIDGEHEFMSNTAEGNKDVAVYQAHCVFDASKIKNQSTHSAALATWAASRGCIIE